MTVRIIHVGLGGWGGSWAREAIPAVSEVEVVGIVDPSADTLQAVRTDLGLPESAAFSSLTAALAAVDADAVVVTAPAVTHVPLALEALDAGKHVLVEKPFANTADEAAAAVHRAEERGLVLQVSQNYRFYPAPQVVRDLLRADTVGELSAINVDFRQWDNDRPFADHPHYRFPHAMFNDMAIHHVDLLRMVTGQEAVRVFAKATYPSFSKYQDEAVASMLIEMAGRPGRELPRQLAEPRRAHGVGGRVEHPGRGRRAAVHQPCGRSGRRQRGRRDRATPGRHDCDVGRAADRRAPRPAGPAAGVRTVDRGRSRSGDQRA